jgi:hypothetical protein
MRGRMRVRAVTFNNEGVFEAKGTRKRFEYVSARRVRWIAGFGSHPSGLVKMTLSFNLENL